MEFRLNWKIFVVKANMILLESSAKGSSGMLPNYKCLNRLYLLEVSSFLLTHLMFTTLGCLPRAVIFLFLP